MPPSASVFASSSTQSRIASRSSLFCGEPGNGGTCSMPTTGFSEPNMPPFYPLCSKIQPELPRDVPHLRIGARSQHALIDQLPKDDVGRVDAGAAAGRRPRLRVADAGMIENVQGIETERQRFGFRNLKLLTEVRVEPVLAGRVQAERHIAAMAGKRILEDDRSLRAVPILCRDRLQR